MDQIVKQAFAMALLITWLAITPTAGFCQRISDTAGIVTDTPSVSPTGQNSSAPKKDLSDVLRGLFKKSQSPVVASDTFIYKPVFSGVVAIGYTLQTKLAAVLSGNVAFRTHNTSRLSTVTANVTYTQNKQFYVPVQSNIWTKNDAYNLIGDYRFYKYPQSTFGLGSASDIKSEDPMDYTFFRFYQVAMRQVSGNFYGGLGYILDYRWHISHKGNKNGSASDYQSYGTAGHTVSSGFTVNGLYDSRDNPINASRGFYAGLQFRNNLSALGSNSNWQSLILDIRKYFSLSGDADNVLALWSYNWLILSGKPPYLDLPSNGWDSYCTTARGYIQGRFRGAQMLYFEGEYRFPITASGFLGGVLYANAETFSARPGTGLQSVQPAFGTGLRLKLKKISKTNLAIDYAFGRQHSRGLFITVGEVF